MSNQFYGQFETDRHILEYFPNMSNGTCIEVGVGDAI